MKDIFILLGSNRGDREVYLAGALEMLHALVDVVHRKSAIYKTEPWGFEDSTQFLNQVVEIETNLTPEELLEQLLTIEVKLGRIRPFDGCGCGIPAPVISDKGAGNSGPPAYAGRTIDLDILFYGQQLVFTDKLMIPHPRLHERRFTLVPLNEIAPDFVHPLLKKTISVLLHECRDQDKVHAATIFDS
ncbi:MAG: 2-amino-4-hydroxy-6-hydroxymethyldihydropteridine diphosphokinase [Bacteroidales bacterium]|nr:2-amino-4-hydroxy-6-hydroxymethyldihydropteridine diphosphokinase [Bacteroidales bacterium]